MIPLTKHDTQRQTETTQPVRPAMRSTSRDMRSEFWASGSFFEPEDLTLPQDVSHNDEDPNFTSQPHGDLTSLDSFNTSWWLSQRRVSSNHPFFAHFSDDPALQTASASINTLPNSLGPLALQPFASSSGVFYHDLTHPDFGASRTNLPTSNRRPQLPKEPLKPQPERLPFIAAGRRGQNRTDVDRRGREPTPRRRAGPQSPGSGRNKSCRKSGAESSPASTRTGNRSAEDEAQRTKGGRKKASAAIDVWKREHISPALSARALLAAGRSTTQNYTYQPHEYTVDDVLKIHKAVYGDDVPLQSLTKFHHLVVRLLCFAYHGLKDEKLVQCMQRGEPLTGAAAFTTHNGTTNHFFSLVLDFRNPPSINACCWPHHEPTLLQEEVTRPTGGPTAGPAGQAYVLEADEFFEPLIKGADPSFLDKLQELARDIAGDFDYDLAATILTEAVIASGRLADEFPSSPLPRFRSVLPKPQKGGFLGAPRLLAVYPSVDVSVSNSVRLGDEDIWVSWNFSMPPLCCDASDPLEISYLDGSRVRPNVHEPVQRRWAPFCCNEITKMHHRRLRSDAIFQALVAHRGSQPDVVYEVKVMKLSGGVFEKDYYKLEDGEVSRVEGKFITKIHAFKNYFCTQHKYWFSVDLFSAENSSAVDESKKATDSSPPEHRNRMRMSPFSYFTNWHFIDVFFEATLGIPPLNIPLVDRQPQTTTLPSVHPILSPSLLQRCGIMLAEEHDNHPIFIQDSTPAPEVESEELPFGGRL